MVESHMHLQCLPCSVNEDTYNDLSTSPQKLSLQAKTATVDTNAHDFDNPLYADPAAAMENGDQTSPGMTFFF